VALDRPYIYGAVNLYDGQVSMFHASQGPCWACLFPESPQEPPAKRPEQLAVLNAVPAVIGALQSTEAIKWIVGKGQTLIGELLIYNALQTSFEKIGIEKNPQCSVCGC
jgi:adenylyltransferase/sulfurtransferase